MPQTMHTITPLITSQLNHKLNFYKRKQGKPGVKKKKIQAKQSYSPFVSLYVFLIIHFTKKPNSVYSNLKMAQNHFFCCCLCIFLFLSVFLILSVTLFLSPFLFIHCFPFFLTFSLSYYRAPYHLIHMTGNSTHPRVTGHSAHTIGVVPARVHHGQILMTATTTTHRCCR